MACSDMDSSVELVRADGEVVHGAWGLSYGENSAATLQQSFDECALEVWTRNPRVASHGNVRGCYPCPFAEDFTEGCSYLPAESGGDLYAGLAPDVIGSEDVRIEKVAHRSRFNVSYAMNTRKTI